MGWFVVFLTVLALLGLGALAALLYPFILLYLPRTDAAKRRSAQHHAGFSGFIFFCALARALNLSFAGHAANVIVEIALMVCAGFLVVFSFGMRPRRIGVPVSLLASGAWLGCLLFSLANALLDGNSPAVVQLENGLICRETVYGFVTADSGEIMDIYRRYLFIDHRLLSQVHSDPEPETNVSPPPAFAATLARCQLLVNAKRQAASR